MNYQIFSVNDIKTIQHPLESFDTIAAAILFVANRIQVIGGHYIIVDKHTGVIVKEI